MKISATIITYNEEKNIRRCLESLYDVVDEIIVVDSISDDRTVDVCKEYGALVTQRPFPGHIEQKNFAISKASHTYILALDADEALSRKLRNEIRQLKSLKQDEIPDGFSLKRKNYFLGKWINYGIWVREFKIRLFKKGAAQWGGTNPHDHIIMKDGSRVSLLKGHLLHYPYDSIADFVQQMNRFSDIAARSYLDHNRKSSIFKIIVNPLWRFFRSYFLSLGFMDGLRGLFLSIMMSFYAFMKYLKLWYYQKEVKRVS